MPYLYRPDVKYPLLAKQPRDPRVFGTPGTTGPIQTPRVRSAFGNRQWNLLWIPQYYLAMNTPYLAIQANGTAYGRDAYGSYMSQTGTTVPCGVSFDTDSTLLLNTISGFAVFYGRNTDFQVMYQTGFSGSPYTNAYGFIIGVNLSSTWMAKKDVVNICSGKGPRIGEMNALAWSYNSTTGVGKIAINGHLITGTSAQTLSHTKAGWGNYWSDTSAGAGDCQLYALGVSPTECLSSGALIEASLDPYGHVFGV